MLGAGESSKPPARHRTSHVMVGLGAKAAVPRQEGLVLRCLNSGSRVGTGFGFKMAAYKAGAVGPPKSAPISACPGLVLPQPRCAHDNRVGARLV